MTNENAVLEWPESDADYTESHREHARAIDDAYTEAALRGLRISSRGGWTLVDDGVDVWLTDEALTCSRAEDWGETRRREGLLDDGDAEAEAYGDLCAYTGHSASRESGRADEADVLAAVRARLLDMSDAHDYWDVGEREDGHWRIDGELVGDDGDEVDHD